MGGRDVLEGTAEAEDTREEPLAGILVSAEEGGREGADPPPVNDIPGRWVVRRGRALDCWRCRRRDSRDGGSTGLPPPWGGGCSVRQWSGCSPKPYPERMASGFRLCKKIPNHVFPVLCSLQEGGAEATGNSSLRYGRGSSGVFD